MSEIMNHTAFLKLFEHKLTPEDREWLDLAYDLAKYAHEHKRQKRESGERYFDHPRAVALIIANELRIYDLVILCSALLHDTEEDDYLLNGRRIAMIFGAEISAVVSAVTKPSKDDPRFLAKEERLRFHFDSVKNGGWKAILVKLADRLHNLRTLGACSPEKQARKSAETKKYFYPLLDAIKRENTEIYKFFSREFGRLLSRTVDHADDLHK